MRTKFALTLLLAVSVVSLIGATRRNTEPAPDVSPKTSQRLIVHEWGTFTNFSGSDGVQLKFRPLVDRLPGFIHKSQRLNPLTKGELLALQRMETPVTYFYADQPREVDVEVGFPRGLLTEFYPPATERMLAELMWNTTFRDAGLAWHARLHPARERNSSRDEDNEPGRPALPAVNDDDHYGFARETDSAIVEVTDSQGQSHHEKFLFYRGVADFSLPLRLEAAPGGQFRVTNDGAHAIDSLFLVIVNDDGLSFRQYAGVSPHGSLNMAAPDSPATTDELSDRMTEALVRAGLYVKEARAMVHTWQSSWFSEPGARLFYLLPRRLTDEILPLTVNPAPDELVRVMVGRMEIITPETTEALLAVIRQHGDCASDDVAPLKHQLARLGRFAEPALNYLTSLQTDEAMRAMIGRVRKIAR
ncbi:MAG TPA: hypothetical protein VFW87_06690 [Pirellulales bacterium]|nr:hypothetical protein [Pirellulales bacterium]